METGVINTWKTEDDIPLADELAPSESKLDAFKKTHGDMYADEVVTKLKDHPRAWLVLVDSDKSDWGIVEDTRGELLWVPGKGDVVGTWTRSRLDGYIHISLMTTINALEDRATATFLQHSQERLQKAAAKASGKRPRKKSGTPAPEEVVPDAETKMAFDRMRAKLKRPGK